MDLSTLNDPQRQAVVHTQGPLLILAGAGSGKTRVLTHRIAYLIEEEAVNPWNIMAITFTNKAAGEMRERVDAQVGYGAESIWVATFHSTCVRILRRYIDRLHYDNHFTIYDTDDQKQLMKAVCKKLDIDTKQMKERTLLNMISSCKNELITPMEYEMSTMGDFKKKKMAQVYREYQAQLKSNNAVDFDDLIMLTVELFKNHPDVLQSYQDRFQYIMVDEYQDTNTAQFELIRLLASGHHNLCVVGDDDQSIYKFRGANIRNILDFEQVYPEARVIKLEQNYRSTQNILTAANQVIKNNKGRKAKALWTDKGDGNPIHLLDFQNAYEEAEFIVADILKKRKKAIADYRDCAILYRTNAQARLLEERFVIEGVPYHVVGGVNFYARREIKDLLCYLKTIENGQDDLAVKRILNVPKRGIGATSVAKVQSYADEKGISFFQALCQAKDIPSLGKAAEKMSAFTNLILVLRSKLSDYALSDLFEELLEETDYIEQMDVKDNDELKERKSNIEELKSKIVQYEETHDTVDLGEFLEEVALVADIDSVNDDDNRVLLMTLHSAKGLEFPNVYLAGMEDGLFPSYMSVISEDRDDLEEERRLAYVGITRAKEDLTITYARQRMINGETQYHTISRFANEISPELFGEKEEKPVSFKAVATATAKPKKVATPKKPFISTMVSNVNAVNGVKEKPKAVVKTGNFGVTKKSDAVINPVSGVTIGRNLNTIQLEYGVGDRVRHMKYKEGTVLKIEPGPRDYQVTVEFDQAGTKVMYAGFAKLVKI